jgi:hypothetical protein
LKVTDRTAVDVLAPPRWRALRLGRRKRPRNPAPRLESSGADQGCPLGTVGVTATTVKITDGEVGDLVAENFKKDCDRRRRELRR